MVGFGCFRASGGLLGARLGPENLAQDPSFYLANYQPWLPSNSSSYEAFWFLIFDARNLILIF